MPNLVRRQWKFFGKVQGVGFRAFCWKSARDWKIRGWARNEPDGSVTVEAEGSADVLEKLRVHLTSRHSWAHVQRVEELTIAARQDLAEGFDIKY